MQCERCDHRLELATKTCPNCGARLATASLGADFDARAVLPEGVEPNESVEALIAMARDPQSSGTEARSAALLLGEVAQPKADVVDALIHLLGARSARTRVCATASLRRLGPKATAAIPALTRLLDTESRTVLGASVQALRVIDPDAPVPASTVADMLELTETSLQHAFDFVSSGTAFVDVKGNLIRSNSAYRRIAASIGVDPYRTVSHTLVELGFLDGPEHWAGLADGTAGPVATERRVPPDDPLGRWISLRGDRGLDSRGRFLCVLLTLDDGTEQRSSREYARATNEQLIQELATRRRAEAELLTAVEERRELTQKILTVQEDERRRIARELHDQIGQALTAVLVGIRPLDDITDPAQIAARTGDLRQITTQALTDIRALAFDVRPSSLDHLGLSATLEQDTARFRERLGIEVHYHGEEADDARLALDLETAVYRATHTALVNVLQHAQAKNVSVLLRRTARELAIIVEDDGVGFEVEPVLAGPVDGRFGLLSMEERVRPFGGRVHVESTAAVGTTVFIQVPVNAVDAKARD
jgi:signal transduction histidine kinase